MMEERVSLSEVIMAAARIKLKIDGVEVEVERGKTILEAAHAAGIQIPTLCHDRRLVPFGACRLCVVQQRGKSELLPACFTPAKSGNGDHHPFCRHRRVQKTPASIHPPQPPDDLSPMRKRRRMCPPNAGL